MQAALLISLWAYLFCMPLSEPGEVFGWLRGWLNKRCPEWLFKPLIGCPKCHAGWVAIGHEIWHCQISENSLFLILPAIAGAYALQTWHLIVEKYLHR